jgi:hypothetical protein
VRSCIAGVETTSQERRWIRLYPVPFRDLDSNQQFAKYQPMRLRAESHTGDRRPETRRPDRDSIELVGEVLPSAHAWEARRRFVEPLIVESMCGVQRLQPVDGTSLAAFRPKEVEDLVIEPRDIDQDKQEVARAWAAQPSLLNDAGADEQTHQLDALEQIPWTFKYRYRCSDAACNGHLQTIVDWEIVQLYRRVRDHAGWQGELTKRWLTEMCGPEKDTAFFVGNQHQHPAGFLVLGVWWPPRQDQLSLLI